MPTKRQKLRGIPGRVIDNEHWDLHRSITSKKSKKYLEKIKKSLKANGYYVGVFRTKYLVNIYKRKKNR